MVSRSGGAANTGAGNAPWRRGRAHYPARVNATAPSNAAETTLTSAAQQQRVRHYELWSAFSATPSVLQLHNLKVYFDGDREQLSPIYTRLEGWRL